MLYKYTTYYLNSHHMVDISHLLLKTMLHSAHLLILVHVFVHKYIY